MAIQYAVRGYPVPIVVNETGSRQEALRGITLQEASTTVTPPPTVEQARVMVMA